MCSVTTSTRCSHAPRCGSLLATETSVLAEPVSPVATDRGADAALASMYDVPVTKASSALRVRDNSLRINTARRSESLERGGFSTGGASGTPHHGRLSLGQ